MTIQYHTTDDLPNWREQPLNAIWSRYCGLSFCAKYYVFSQNRPGSGTSFSEALPPMQKMRTLTTIIFLTVLTACSNDKEYHSATDATTSIVTTPEQVTSTIKPVLTGNDLVDKINEIKNIPLRTLSIAKTEIDSIAWNCGDSLYWEIVQLGQEAIPYLITKVQDSSTTDIQIPCRESNLTVGTIAFMAIDDIVSIPYFLVFQIQWDVLDLNCDFGYPIGLLEYMNTHPQEAHKKLTKWFDKFGKTIKKEKLNSADQSDCQLEYEIDYKLTIKYE